MHDGLSSRTTVHSIADTSVDVADGRANVAGNENQQYPETDLKSRMARGDAC